MRGSLIKFAEQGHVKGAHLMLGERALGAWDNVEIHQCSKKALEISATEQPSKFLKTHSARQATRNEARKTR